MILNYLPQGGFIEVITGPMFAEKSTLLMSQLRKEVIAGKRTMVFKPDIDDRYHTDNIMTHDGDSLHAYSIPCTNSNQILAMLYDGVDAVGIDEGQFFDSGLVDVVRTLADRGMRVIVAGVDMDYRGLPFEPMNDIMAIAEIVHKQTAVCTKCGKPATMIQRYTNNRLSAWSEPTVIVGSNKEDNEYYYEARCRKCYKQPNKPEMELF